jgi:hypothetical protein
MTQDEIKALIEDLRLNHEFCLKEVILQAADELERMQVRIPRPPKREWVGLTDEEVNVIIDKEIGFNSCWGPEEKFARAIEAKLKEKNHDRS